MRKKIIASTIALLTIVNTTPAFAEDVTKDVNYQTEVVAVKKTEGSVLKENNERAYVDIYNPNNYKTVTPGNTAGYMWDDFDSSHSITFLGIEDWTSTEMLLKLEQFDTNSVANSYIDVEFYRPANGKTQYIGKSEFYVSRYDYSRPLNIALPIDWYKNQPYIYMRVGVYNVRNINIFTDEIVFKVANPYYNDYQNHWAATQIKTAMNKGWVKTTSEFRPDASITRAEFIKIVNKAFGFKKKTTTEPFNDVVSTDWWYNEVLIALGNGYISTSNSNFRPKDPITREEVANIITTITRTKDTNLDKLNTYYDKNLVSNSMKSSVEGAIEKGYMGKGGKYFNPKKNITRAETVVTLERVVK